MRVYLSYSDFVDRSYIKRVRKELEKDGHTVHTRCRIWKMLPYPFSLIPGLVMLCFCDSLYLLAGWTESDQSRLDHYFASVTGKLISYDR